MKIVLTLLLVCWQLVGYAQIKAVTETGEEVMLNKDGTWKYVSGNVQPSWTTRLDTQSFTRDKSSTFLVKGKNVKYGVWIDPRKWSFKLETEAGSPREYMFTLKNEDLYCMVIPEKMVAPLDALTEAAYINAKKTAPDAQIVLEEYRNVNGNLVKMVKMTGTVSGIKLIFLGYYYSGKVGSIQLVCYTSEPLFDEYKSQMDIILNGFTAKVD